MKAFESLKRELASAPILALYDHAADTELHTDACSKGLGAILLQKQKNGTWLPVAYYSQATNQAETRYHSFELEMLAIVRAVERFHLYLYGKDFTVVTDCNALGYAVNKANFNARIARWTLSLQNYRFRMLHRAGRRMLHVDALNRSVGYVRAMPLERELKFQQLSDSRIKEIARELEYKDNDKFTLVDGLVYKKDEDQLRFAVPEIMVPSILRANHDDLAHVGSEKTYQSISANYWFPSMRGKIRNYIDNCLTCLMANEAPNRQEGETSLYPLPEQPLEVLHVDHFGPLQETSDGYRHVFVAVDAFTRFTWLIPTKTTSTRETICTLRSIFNIFGNPIESQTAEPRSRQRNSRNL